MPHAFLIFLQVVLCVALLVFVVWRLNHMTEGEAFTVRWYYLAALSLALLGIAACVHPHPVFMILPAVMLAAYGVHRYAHHP